MPNPSPCRPSYPGLCHLHPSSILYQCHRCGFTRCRFLGKVINDGSCGPSHSPSLPDLVLPLLFQLACLSPPFPKERDKRSRARGRGGIGPCRVAAVDQALCQALLLILICQHRYREAVGRAWMQGDWTVFFPCPHRGQCQAGFL